MESTGTLLHSFWNSAVQSEEQKIKCVITGSEAN